MGTLTRFVAVVAAVVVAVVVVVAAVGQNFAGTAQMVRRLADNTGWRLEMMAVNFVSLRKRAPQFSLNTKTDDSILL